VRALRIAAASAALLGGWGWDAVASEPGPGRVGSPAGTGAHTRAGLPLALGLSSALGTGVHTGGPPLGVELFGCGVGATTCQLGEPAGCGCAGVALGSRFHCTAGVWAMLLGGTAGKTRAAAPRAPSRGAGRWGLGMEQQPAGDGAALQVELLAQAGELAAGGAAEAGDQQLVVAVGGPHQIGAAVQLGVGQLLL